MSEGTETVVIETPKGPPRGRTGPTGYGSPIAEHPLPLDIATLGPLAGPYSEVLETDAISGLLHPFVPRARKVLAVLLAGRPERVAALAAGMSKDSTDRWRNAHPAFREAYEIAKEWGFGAVYESELYDRALDREDRASGRLLEMVVKSRAPEYRDKQSGTLEVIHRMMGSGAAMLPPPEDVAPPEGASET